MFLRFASHSTLRGMLMRSVFLLASSAIPLCSQTTPWYDPVMHTPPYNPPATTWSPGSTAQPQTQNPYVVDLAKAASRYTPPNPYVSPTPAQTRWYIDNHPNLWNLPSQVKDQIANGTPGALNGRYLPNGTTNPFYSNGQVVPNWYLPATWSSTGTNWQGVQPNGFMPASSSTVYNPSLPSSGFTSVRTNTVSIPNYNANVVSQQQQQQRPPTYAAPTRPSESGDGISRPVFSAPTHVERAGSNPIFPVKDVAGAIASGRRSLALSESAGDKVGQVTNHAALAELFVQQGNLERARAHAGLAESIAGRHDDPALKATLLRAQATILMASGEFEKAVDHYQRLAAALTELSNDRELAEAQTSLGWAWQSMGDVPRALASYEKARALFRKLGDHDGETRVVIGIGSLYQAMGEGVKASEQYMQVQAYASEEQYARMLVSVGEIYAAAGSPLEALNRFEKALALKKVDHDSPLGVSILTGIARCHMAMGRYLTAQRYMGDAHLKAIMTGDHRLEAGVLASLGELHYWMAVSPSFSTDVFAAEKNLSEALKAYRRSLELTRAAGDRLGEIGVLTNTGLAYDARGKQNEALEHYLSALQRLDELQTGARLEEFRINLAGQSTRLYQRAIELEAGRHRMEEAFNLSERSRARAFLDQLGNSRIDPYREAPRDYIQREDDLRSRNIALQRQLGLETSKPGPELNGERIRTLQEQIAGVQREYQEALLSLKLSTPAYASFLSVAPLTLSEVQRTLPPETTVVSYFTTPDLTLAFVITSRSFHATRLPVKAGQLAGAVLRFRDFSGPNTESATLKSLHAWLIEPLRSQLKTSKLIFVPHGVLNDLPFAALTSDGSDYLGDRYTISYLPSASVLPYLKAKGEHSDRMVVLANDQEAGAPQLAHAYDEARAVASLGTSRLLLGNDATASALQSMAGDYDILHLVGHVYLDRDAPEFSRISLGQPRAGDGALDLNGVLRLNLKKTNLVVLSGCQTQTGRRSRGDDVIALNRAFLYAGASSVIASLWSVDDDATRQLMVAFYTHLKEDPDKARALRLAQTDVRKKYPGPYYWAGFVLTGDAGERGRAD